MQYDAKLARVDLYQCYSTYPAWVQGWAKKTLAKIYNACDLLSKEDGRYKAKKLQQVLMREAHNFAYVCCIEPTRAQQIEILLQSKVKNGGCTSLIRLFQKIHQGTFKSLPEKYEKKVAPPNERPFDEFIFEGRSIAIISKPLNQSLWLGHHIVVILVPLGDQVEIHAKVAFVLSKVRFSGKCELNVQKYAFTLVDNPFLRVTAPFSSIINHSDTSTFADKARDTLFSCLKNDNVDGIFYSLIALSRYVLHRVPHEHLAKELTCGDPTDISLSERIDESSDLPMKLLDIR
jgi:hypothetical protein